ncbi:MAG: cohesin domain-containing protein, partial [bacterium]|nr:cohesin domain-containing protein [bacterium]
MRRVIVFTLFFVATNLTASLAQVDVSIPDSTAATGSIVEIPVNVSDITGLEVISFDIWITFDQTVLSFDTLITSGTLSDLDSSQTLFNDVGGEIKIGSYIYARVPYSGSGALIKLRFSVIGDPFDQTNLQFSRCLLSSFNAGNLPTNPQGGVFTVDSYQVSVTVTTSLGSGSKVIVDGVEHNAPYETTWDAGEQYTINVNSPQNQANGSRYVFSNWSDGGNQSHSVKIFENTTFTANFKTQHYLKIESEHGNPTGAGWYDEGAQAQISIQSPVSGPDGTRYLFDSWVGSGNGSYSGNNNPASVLVNEPIIETVNWNTQHYLTVSSSRGNPDGQGWYKAGATAQFSVDQQVTVPNDSKYEFSSWTGNGSGSYSGGDNPGSVVMNNPIRETANWEATHYYISTSAVPSDGGTISPNPPGLWGEAGSSIEVAASPNINYLFMGWSGDLSGTNNPANLIVDAPKNVTANFAKQEIILDRETTPDNYEELATRWYTMVNGADGDGFWNGQAQVSYGKLA